MIMGDYPCSVHVGLKKKAFFTIEHEENDGIVKELMKISPVSGFVVDGRDVLNEIDELKKENQELKERIEEMDEIITQLYYNPAGQGGPGYELAKTDFLQLSFTK